MLAKQFLSTNTGPPSLTKTKPGIHSAVMKLVPWVLYKALVRYHLLLVEDLGFSWSQSQDMGWK